MFDSNLLKRVGLWTLAGSAFVGLVLPQLTAEHMDLEVAKHAAAAGIAAIALAFLIEMKGSGKPCARCGRRSVAGSVFCAQHRHRLAETAGRTNHQLGSDQRRW